MKSLSELIGQNFTFVFKETFETIDYQRVYATLCHDYSHYPWVEIDFHRVEKDVNFEYLYYLLSDMFRNYLTKLRSQYKSIEQEWAEHKQYVLSFYFPATFRLSPATLVGDDSVNIVDGQHRLVGVCVVGELEKNNVNVRFYRTYYDFDSKITNEFVSSSQISVTLHFSFVVFSKDGLTHFQNLRVPPKPTLQPQNNTLIVSFTGSGVGCSVDPASNVSNPKICWRDQKCKNSRKYMKSASSFWRMFLQERGEQSNHYCKGCIDSSIQDQISQKRPSLYYTMSANVSSKNSMLMQLTSSPCFSFSSQQAGKTTNYTSLGWFN